MKRTRNGILIPDVSIMAAGNLPNAVKGMSSGGGGGFDPSRLPFYIDVRGTVTLAATSGLQMSTDGKTWTDTVAGDLPTGKTYFRVVSDKTSPLKPNWTENSNSDYDIGGNINSLVKKDFENDTTCYSFSSYFGSKRKLKSAGNLILPAITLANGCYKSMFAGCWALTTAPELPATTLAQGCYSTMFSQCYVLTSVPTKLPATTLAQSCYDRMFDGCSALTTAPELPATTLAQSCYGYMFQGCSALTTAPELPATTMAESCYCAMFASCTSLTTAPELPAMTLAQSCYQNMFSGCTSLTAAPELPATSVWDRTKYCYEYMFRGCSNINYIKCLAKYFGASTDYLKDWVNGVASSGTFVRNPSMTSWPTGTSGIPSGWTVEEID